MLRFLATKALVRLCYDEWGASDVNRAKAYAAHFRHKEIVQLCRDVWGASEVNSAVYGNLNHVFMFGYS